MALAVGVDVVDDVFGHVAPDAKFLGLELVALHEAAFLAAAAVVVEEHSVAHD